MFRRYRLRDYNFRLVIFLVLTSVIGVLLMSSASPSLVRRQLFGSLAGIVLMVIFSLVDYSWILRFSWVLYLINIALLAAVLLQGRRDMNAARWIDIGPLQFQPTELGKVLIILFFAMYFMKHENDLSTIPVIFRSLLLILFPLALVMREPDLKNTITIALIFFILYFIAGLSYKAIGAIVLIAASGVMVFLLLVTQTDLKIVEDYQKERIVSFISSDEEEYTDAQRQQDNSVMAIGSGQLLGKGLNNNDISSANKGSYVAEIQTDFIFAVAGEELGFAGSVVILILLFLIVLECIRMGKRSKDLAGKLICCGVASIVAFQSFINICVATGIIPNTGTPLPFISYGLTSILSLYIGMGIVLNVGLQRKRSIIEERIYARAARK